MTALIGIHCQDGVVIGSDSSATISHNPQFRTIEQTVKKIDIIQDQVILASTGAGGMAQRFHEVVKNYWIEGTGKSKSHIEVGKELCALGRKDFGSTSAQAVHMGRFLRFLRARAERPFVNLRSPIFNLNSKPKICGLFQWEAGNLSLIRF
jgi:hypothetical protein